MRYRRTILSAVLAVPVVAGLTTLAMAADQAPATGPASRPAASQPVIPSDPPSIRKMISRLRTQDPIEAADAVVQLKLLAKRGVPVWDQMEDADPVSARLLLTWLRDHPGNIHHPSPLRVQWDSMDIYRQELDSGKFSMMGNVELIEYGRLAREMIRDGDPYGYYAILDVCRTAMDILNRGPDQVTFAYVLPYLDMHLDQHLTFESIKQWKGYWAKPLTEKRKWRSPIQPSESDGTPQAPDVPWQIPTRLLLTALDSYQARLDQLGLWLTPPWEKQFTAKTPLADLLKAISDQPFPARQHIWRLIRARMGDMEARKQVALTIDQNHPRARLLQLALDQTPLLLYADAIRKVWPKEFAEQCPGTLEDLVSDNPRRQYEAAMVVQATLLYWPDRDWANRTAIAIYDAAGSGASELSVAALLCADNQMGADKILEIYRKGNVPDNAYNAMHRWMNSAVSTFRTACADKDLAPLMLKLTTATQPAIDTSKKDWSQILRMAYELVWWRLNNDKLYWNDKTHRLEVPEDQLVYPTEEQILASYGDRSKLLRSIMEARSTRKIDIGRQPKP